MGTNTYISSAAKHSRTPLFSGKLFPCGDFSFGAVPSQKRTIKEAELDRCRESATVTTSEFIGYRSESKQTTRDIPLYEMGNRLISTLLPNCAKNGSEDGEKSRRHGMNGISSYGRKMLKSACKMLEDRFGKKQLGFLTVTLPDVASGLSRSDLRSVHLKWSEIQRNFLRSLSREIEGKGGYPGLVCSTEIQEKRYKETGIPALHLHIVFNSWDGVSLLENGRYAWFVPVARIRVFWESAICNALDRDRGSINFNASCNVKLVKKSAVGYLGKYLSKGAKVTRDVIEAGKKHWLPKKWWSLYGGLRSLVLASIVRLDSQDCLSILENREAWRDGKVLHKFYSVEIELKQRPQDIENLRRDDWLELGDSRSIIIGYAGSFTPWGYVLYLGDIFEREQAASRGGDCIHA